MKERFERKPLDEYDMELLFEVLDSILAERGQPTTGNERMWDRRVSGMTLDMSLLLEDAYLMGYRDAIVRSVYASDVSEHKSKFAQRLRDDIEGKFQNHRPIKEQL